MEREKEGLKTLGKKTDYNFDYNPNLLEKFSNKHKENDYFIKFNCPEFTSLCPITGQPDFATIYISYIADEYCVESKSLLNPRYIEVWGKFLPRGGISIDPYANYGRPNTKYEEMANYRLMNHDLYLEKVDNR